MRILRAKHSIEWQNGVMTNSAKDTRSTIIPALRYRNAKTMIDWLGTAFGFTKKAVYPGPNDTILHAELIFGNGMIMIGSADNTTASTGLYKQPDEIGGAETQAPYIIVTDIDGLYQCAKTAGAKIVSALETKEYGGKAFTCTDPEGHLWLFGTYDPWVNG